VKKLKEDLYIINVLIFVLVVILFLSLFVLWVEKNTETKELNNVEIDETTGCEYYVFRRTLIPRVDETGTKVRGCKESER